MTIRNAVFATLMAAAWLSMPFSASAANEPLSLKHGVYVSDGTPCKGAPNAAILSWDGIGFSGAHSSHCTSQLLHQEDGRYQVNTSCSAIGDSSPNAAGADYKDSFLMTRLSRTRFERVKADQAPRTYRWCAASAMTLTH